MQSLIWALVVLDALLLVVFVIFIARLRRVWGTVRSIEDIEKLLAPIQDFLDAAGRTGEEMEQNLAERRRIMTGLLDGLDDKAAELRRLITAAEAAGTGRAPAPPAAAAASNRPSLPTSHQRVLDLAEQGRDVEQIAAELAIPRGEVQLILDLNRKF